jgi:aminoglycoside phosphotransferase (APT) family kinase protein
MPQRFRDSLAYWRTREPALFDIEVVTQLVPHLTSYFAAHNDLFTGLASFSLLHGDLCVPNILFDHGTVHYIDWEWMAYGDPALDVAQLGWDIANPPWQLVPLGQRLEAYLGAYAAERPDATLRQRREIWMVYLKFFDHLHYRTKAQQQAGAGVGAMTQYQAAVERITASLTAQFLT